MLLANLIDAIADRSDSEKVDFIQRVLSSGEQGQRDTFKRKAKVSSENTEKLFYLHTEHGKQRREWIFVINNVFYCVYCVCFSTWRSDLLSTTGVDYNNTNSRLSQKLTSHEHMNIHDHAIRTYLLLSRQQSPTTSNRNIARPPTSTREAVKCIIKVIIFISTHGEIFFKFLILRISISANILVIVACRCRHISSEITVLRKI